MPVDAAQQAALNSIVQECANKYPEFIKYKYRPYTLYPGWHYPASHIELRDRDVLRIDDCVVVEFHTEGIRVIYNIFHNNGKCFIRIFTVDYGANDSIKQTEKLILWAASYMGTETEPDLKALQG
jgi:hypothetical protein